MKNTPENKILTSSEIGALSPRVPRQSEALIDVPKPKEARLFLEDGTEITYLPEAVGGNTPGTTFTKKGDGTKKKWTLRGGAKSGDMVLELESGEGVLISSRDFESNYERSSRIYIERTREGKDVKINMEEVLKDSVGFYNTHDLKDLLKDLPQEIRLSARSEAKLRETMKDGFDKAMLLPKIESQAGQFDKLVTETATKPIPGLPETEQYTTPYIDSTVKSSRQAANRPAGKAYLLLYQSNPVPQETKGKTPTQLEPMFQAKKWNGLTLEEYMMLQRKEVELKKDHSFDAYNSSDATRSQWTWLLDSRVSEGVVHAYWVPRYHQVVVYWSEPEFSDDVLGARPVVVVEIEV